MQKSNTETLVPTARTSDLATTQVKDEVLVYDEQRHHIHNLNQVAATVWRFCDGQRTVRDVALITSIDEDAVRIALRKLEDANLLDGSLSTEMRGDAQSRRAFMKRAAIAGAVALPTIVSITAPQAAAASSHGATGDPCSSGSDCISGICTLMGICL